MGIKSSTNIRILRRNTKSVDKKEEFAAVLAEQNMPLSYKMLTSDNFNGSKDPLRALLESDKYADMTPVEQGEYFERCFNNFVEINGSLFGNGSFGFYDKIWHDDNMSKKESFVEWSMMITRVTPQQHNLELWTRPYGSTGNKLRPISFSPTRDTLNVKDYETKLMLVNFLKMLGEHEGKVLILNKYKARENNYNKTFVHPFNKS